MTFKTEYKLDEMVITEVFDTQAAQDAHTGSLWDADLMNKIEWIDYDEIKTIKWNSKKLERLGCGNGLINKNPTTWDK